MFKHKEATAELRQLEEQQRAVGLKDEAMEQEIRRREEAEEKLRMSERAGEELWKHKAAFMELASAQRQLQADLARAAHHVGSAEAELKAALERRDKAAATAAELSAEAVRLRRDVEHKDKILSVMLHKSKIDMEDREIVVREMKMCKARRSSGGRCGSAAGTGGDPGRRRGAWRWTTRGAPTSWPPTLWRARMTPRYFSWTMWRRRARKTGRRHRLRRS